nr:cation diffusion facilitator family transporter [Anaerolineae bacterium]
GHRRFETLASMLIGGMLLLSGWEIIKASIGRLLSETIPEIELHAFIAMAFTLVVNIGIATYEHRMGKRLRSTILLVDATHTRSDIWVSLTVLGSLVASRLGWGWVDAATALLVVALIGRAAWHIIRQAVDVLVDRAPLDGQTIEKIVSAVAGIQRVARVRSRGADNDIHLDLEIIIDPSTTAQHSEAIANEIRARLRAQFDGISDIQVFFIPSRDKPSDFALIARAEGDTLGLSVHEIIPSGSEREPLMLEMHVEVSPELTIGEAHDLVSDFEKRLHNRLPELSRLVTHIEPAHAHDSTPLHAPSTYLLADKALRIVRRLYPGNHWHDLFVRRESDGGYALSMHCRVDSGLALEDAHRIAEECETAIRADLPEFHRVTIHTEPYDR